MPLLLIVLLFFAGRSLAADQPIELPTATGILSGTLSTPDTAGPFPIALIVAGSGPTDRGARPGSVADRVPRALDKERR